MIQSEFKNILVREMNQKDEENFRNLLSNIYGNTYSYKHLYEPGGYSKLLSNPSLLCIGQFDKEENLIGHTGLQFDQNEGYCYSCFSMRKWNSEHLNRNEEKSIWKLILDKVSERAVYLHQNTSTYHLAAQIYSKKMLNSNPTGLILNFSIDEKYTSIPTPKFPMQALCQTSIIKKEAPKKVILTTNNWSNWIKLCFKDFNRVFVPSDYCNDNFSLINYSTNRSLGHCTRKIVEIKGNQITRTNSRVDIIYASFHNQNLFSELLLLGYLPVGIKLNPYRDDELVFQHLTSEERISAIENLENSFFLERKSRKMIKEWIELCLETI